MADICFEHALSLNTITPWRTFNIIVL